MAALPETRSKSRAAKRLKREAPVLERSQSRASKRLKGEAPQPERTEEFQKKQDFFKRNARLIITEMVNLSQEQPSELVDEVLHSIFCLGKINNPPYTPESIVDDDELLKKLKSRYPRPFELFSSQLPRRSPISCFLEMIVNLMGQENETEIRKRFQEFIVKLKKNQATALVSNTICVSQPDKTSARYYGASMSTSGCLPGRIIVAAGCLSGYWDSYVAGAVMTYYPEMEKKPDFDGTIKLPSQVRCEAFSLSGKGLMAPCRSCGKIFGLETKEEQEWPSGNCAEIESVSNLLKNEKEVRERARPTAASCTDANRQRAEVSVRKKLVGYLRERIFQWDNNFYTPQV